jgi:hypothetical protein
MHKVLYVSKNLRLDGRDNEGFRWKAGGVRQSLISKILVRVDEPAPVSLTHAQIVRSG